MRAVNLLPSDLRGAAPKAASGARQDKAEGFGAYVVLGILALCVAALAGYVLTSNSVKQRTADLESAKARAAAASQKAAALKPYADFDAMAKARVETVRGLAAARFDWDQALRDLARAVPGDVKLTSLNGDMGLPGASGADPLRASIQAPAITMAGCATSQSHVARMMARVRAVDGVTRVSLSKSEKPESGTAAGDLPCAGDSPPSFSLVIFFERSDAAAALAPAGSGAAESPVPVPNAVNKPGGAAAGAAADGTTGAAEQPQAAAADASAGTTTNSTTTGGTP